MTFSKVKILTTIEATRFSNSINIHFGANVCKDEMKFYENLSLENYIIQKGLVFPMRSTPRGIVCLFGLVLAFFSHKGKTYIISQVIHNIRFNRHLYSYELEIGEITLNNEDILSVTEIKEVNLDIYNFTSIYSVKEKWYASLKRLTSCSF